MNSNSFYFFILVMLVFSCCSHGSTSLDVDKEIISIDSLYQPKPDPTSRILYNGITLATTWPPYSSYAANLYTGMKPTYLKEKPEVIDITMGRQLFVDDFLIQSTSLTRTWHQAEYYIGNPILSPDKDWEKLENNDGGFAAPFSDGVWYDELDNKFKMWYMGGGAKYGEGNAVTCYAESSDGILWTRPSLNLEKGTNIVHKGVNRDSYSVWIDKTEENANKRMKMFGVSGGAGNWKYHYYTSQDGKAWREQAESQAVADRSTVFKNSFRGIWAFSMRHNIRVDDNTLIRARDYQENSDPEKGTVNAKAELTKYWCGPWPDEPKHPDYITVKPAIYNLDAIAYESILLGQFSIWSGPENDVCSSNHVIKRNQILLGYSRDGWQWYREDFTPFCSVSSDKTSWNNGNIQSTCGSPIIVDDKLYFYMSGRQLNSNNKEIVSTGLATLRRDGFASMGGSGELITEKLKFNGQYFFVNAKIDGSLKVEILDSNGNVINDYSKDMCIASNGDATKTRIQWKNKASLIDLKGQIIRIKFYVENGDLYAFWISQKESGTSFGYTSGGCSGCSQYGIDL